MNLPLKEERTLVHFSLFSLSSLWDGHQRNNTEGIACPKVFSITKEILVGTMDIFNLISTHNNYIDSYL